VLGRNILKQQLQLNTVLFVDHQVTAAKNDEKLRVTHRLSTTAKDYNLTLSVNKTKESTL
jgi:hypothetical protein